MTASAQDVRANLAQANVRFELEGTRRGDAFAVKRFVAAAGGGTLTAEGTVGLAGTQAFDARAKLDRFDPSAFGAYPSARINADIAATGALAPRWHADARFDVRDSRWRDARLDGNGRLAASPSEVHDVHASLRVGANRLVAQGGLGRRGDSLAISLAAPRLADLDPRLAGRARVNGTLRGALERPAVELDASAEQLELPGGYRATALTAHGTLSPDDDPRVDLDVAATTVSAGRIVLGAASAKASGSFARHVVDLAAAGDGIDFAGRLVGRWRRADGWSGTVETLANRGRFPAKLVAPVAVETGPGRIAIGAAAVELGDGRLEIQRLRWERGRLSTQGELAGVAIAPFLALAGLPPEVATTLVVRGAWSIDTTPRLNGTIALARESGDIAVGDPAHGSAARLPLELTRLEAAVRLVDDTASGTVALDARQLGTANGTFELGRGPAAEPGTLSIDAPLAAHATAAIASLRPLGVLLDRQPIIEGALDATLAADGTLRSPRVTGRIDGSRLALQIPSHGVRLVNGRLAATLDADALRVDEFEIRGGEGRLTARGVAPRAGDTAITWQAENLRLFGLPDRLLTVDGAGKLQIVRGQVVLEGAIAVREGYFEFARGSAAALGDDVVVVGRPEKPGQRTTRQRSPLRATLDLDFGRSFRIVGAGLDTGLTGKLARRDARLGRVSRAGRGRRGPRAVLLPRTAARDRARAADLRRSARESRARRVRGAPRARGGARRRADRNAPHPAGADRVAAAAARRRQARLARARPRTRHRLGDRRDPVAVGGGDRSSTTRTRSRSGGGSHFPWGSTTLASGAAASRARRCRSASGSPSGSISPSSRASRPPARW